MLGSNNSHLIESETLWYVSDFARVCVCIMSFCKNHGDEKQYNKHPLYSKGLCFLLMHRFINVQATVAFASILQVLAQHPDTIYRWLILMLKTNKSIIHQGQTRESLINTRINVFVQTISVLQSYKGEKKIFIGHSPFLTSLFLFSVILMNSYYAIIILMLQLTIFFFINQLIV